MLATDLKTRLAAVEAEVEQLKSLLPMGKRRGGKKLSVRLRRIQFMKKP